MGLFPRPGEASFGDKAKKEVWICEYNGFEGSGERISI